MIALLLESFPRREAALETEVPSSITCIITHLTCVAQLCVCVRAMSVEDDPLPQCLLEPFQVKTPIRHLLKQGSMKENKQVFKMRRDGEAFRMWCVSAGRKETVKR